MNQQRTPFHKDILRIENIDSTCENIINKLKQNVVKNLGPELALVTVYDHELDQSGIEHFEQVLILEVVVRHRAQHRLVQALPGGRTRVRARLEAVPAIIAALARA